jgi:competence protein ComGC
MNTANPNNLSKGLTILEVSMILALLAILALLFLGALSGAKMIARKLACTNNLKQIAIAFRVFANDHNDHFPMELPVKDGGTKECVEFGLVTPHFLVISSNGLNVPNTLVCPADKRVSAKIFSELRSHNCSYFVGLDTTERNTRSLLAGDRNVDNGSGLNTRVMLLSSNQLVKWKKEIHQDSGNVLTGDGSVQSATSSQLGDLLRNSSVATNRLAIP